MKISAIESRLGFSLRDYQMEAFEFLMRGFDVIFHVPTGAGKTAVFQAASMAMEGMTVVVFPLIALIKDQHRRFGEDGIDHAVWFGATKAKERKQITAGIASGEIKVLLTTPESLKASRCLREALSARGVSLFVVDEAHVLDEWAATFRAAYRELGWTISQVRAKQVLLCSATLTAEGFAEAVRYLNRFSNWQIVCRRPTRDNLSYLDLCMSDGNPIEAEDWIEISKKNGRLNPSIIYCMTVKRLANIKRTIEMRWGESADLLVYHGQLPEKQKLENQNLWFSSARPIIATKAFGMGIDKPDVRSIVHSQLPASILDYAQETGRAGRDGLPSRCWLTQNEHGEAAEFLNSQAIPSMDVIYRVWGLLEKSNPTPFCKDDFAERIGVSPQVISNSVSWLKTERLIREEKKPKNWTFLMADDAIVLAEKMRGKVDKAGIVRAIIENSSESANGLLISQDVLRDELTFFCSNWREQVRKMMEYGIFKATSPSNDPAMIWKLKEKFEFDETHLEMLRTHSCERLFDMRRLQATPTHERSQRIMNYIDLDISRLKEELLKNGNMRDDEKAGSSAALRQEGKCPEAKRFNGRSNGGDIIQKFQGEPLPVADRIQNPRDSLGQASRVYAGPVHGVETPAAILDAMTSDPDLDPCTVCGKQTPAEDLFPKDPDADHPCEWLICRRCDVARWERMHPGPAVPDEHTPRCSECGVFLCLDNWAEDVTPLTCKRCSRPAAEAQQTGISPDRAEALARSTALRDIQGIGGAGLSSAHETCARCRRPLPVLWVEVRGINGRLAICADCWIEDEAVSETASARRPRKPKMGTQRAMARRDHKQQTPWTVGLLCFRQGVTAMKPAKISEKNERQST